MNESLGLSSSRTGNNYAKFDKPVVLITFNRPENTREVLFQISKVKPRELFFISDGPRKDKLGENELVNECRELASLIDWECKVHTKFSTENLGCRRSVSSGLSWVFSLVDEAVILEDDCVPSEDFFYFCADLLNKYRDDSNVGSISGTNLDGHNIGIQKESYYFSKFPSVWGWATWRRVWDGYSDDLRPWKSSFINELTHQQGLVGNARRFWVNKFTMVKMGLIDTWDYQLVFHHWRNGMVSAIPSRNLVSNTGFGPSATHTLQSKSPFANMKTESLIFPLIHPENVAASEQDSLAADKRFSQGRLRFFVELLFALLPKGFARSLATIISRVRSH
jgi:GR25 family glycosyltransferase involved in LPS biosynthesis